MGVLNTSDTHLDMRVMTSFDTIDDAAGPWRLPISSESLAPNLTWMESDEDTGRRQTSLRDLGMLDGGGDIQFPFRFGTTASDFIQDILFSGIQDDNGVTGTAIAVAATDISFDATGNTITDDGDDGDFANIVPGDIIRVGGASNAGNNSDFLVTDKTGTDVLTVAWGTLTTEIAGASVTIDAVRARNGSSNTYWALQRTWAQASPQTYYAFLNAAINNMSITSRVGEFSSVTLGMLTDAPGDTTNHKTATSSIWSNPHTQVETGGVVPRSAVHNRRNLRIDDTAATFYTGVTLDMVNNGEIDPHAEELGVNNYSFGDFGMTGALEWALQPSDFALIDKAAAGESFTLSFAINDLPDKAANASDTETIYFRFTCRADDPGSINRSGRSQIIQPNFSWTAEPTYETAGDPYILQISVLPAIT